MGMHGDISNWPESKSPVSCLRQTLLPWTWHVLSQWKNSSANWLLASCPINGPWGNSETGSLSSSSLERFYDQGVHGCPDWCPKVFCQFCILFPKVLSFLEGSHVLKNNIFTILIFWGMLFTYILRNDSAILQRVHGDLIKQLLLMQAVFDIKIKCDSPHFVLVCLTCESQRALLDSSQMWFLLLWTACWSLIILSDLSM